MPSWFCKVAIGLSRQLRLIHSKNWKLGFGARDGERKSVRWSDEKLHVVCIHYQKVLVSGKVNEVSSRAAGSQILSEYWPSRSVESFKQLSASERLRMFLSQLDSNACHMVEVDSNFHASAEMENECHEITREGKKSRPQVTPKMKNGRWEITKEQVCEFKGENPTIRFFPKTENENHEIAGESEDTLHSTRDQFAKLLPNFDDRKNFNDKKCCLVMVENAA